MRYLRYISLLVVAVVATSCMTNEIDEQGSIQSPGSGDLVEVCARIANYDDCNVDTRSAKTDEEAKVSSMALALFPIDGGAIQPCIYYDYKSGSNVTFTIDRKDEVFDDVKDQSFVMYVFANIENDSAKMGVGKTLDEFRGYYESTQAEWYSEANVDGVGLPTNGFPMIGSLGDASADGKTFVLKPTVSTENPHELPLVDSKPSDLLNIPMEVMFAKFSFTITLKPTQSLSGNTQQFTMTKYTLHNIPAGVDFKDDNNDSIGVLDDAFDIPVNSVVMEGNSGEDGSGRGAITFSFYLPERKLTPETSADDYDYPFRGRDGGSDTDGDGIRDEDEELRQRYKPELVSDSQKASYVTIEGEYIDHNRRSWNVKYDIYLGKDNYANFDFEHNVNYNNSVVIRGITNANDQTTDEESISIDHRVTVERGNPIIENLRRETLLDSHFEVRPLRIRPTAGHVGESVTVSIEPINTGDATPSWIRLEHKNDGTAKNGYDDYLSNGKRKYFTYGLVTGYGADGLDEGNNLSQNTSVTFSTTDVNTNETIWIYVDECTDVYGFTSEGTVDVKPRSAKLVVTVPSENYRSEYIINQSKLYPISITGPDKVITGTNDSWTASDADVTRNYLIESYEEYLYNYDAEDTYEANITHFEGMAWGLSGKQLSSKHKSLDIRGFENYGKLSDAQQVEHASHVNSYYDFYIAKHDYEMKVPDMPHTRNGYKFCEEIIEEVGSIGVRTLGENPESAVEYCYNKNKRDKSGNVVDAAWYLPAIDEIEDIMVGAYDAFEGVFQEQDYWSCQPSYHRCFFFLSRQYGGIFNKWWFRGFADYYMDDTENARSTKATFNGYIGGVADYSYNPSGVVVPTYDPPTKEAYSRTYTIKGGYYMWHTYRGTTEAEGNGKSENGVYDYKNACLPDNPVWPMFDEEQQPGSKERTERHRVRCVRKL